MKKLYLVYWNNNEYVGGYEKRDGRFVQRFNYRINDKYIHELLKEYEVIEVWLEDEFIELKNDVESVALTYAKQYAKQTSPVDIRDIGRETQAEKFGY